MSSSIEPRRPDLHVLPKSHDVTLPTEAGGGQKTSARKVILLVVAIIVAIQSFDRLMAWLAYQADRLTGAIVHTAPPVCIAAALVGLVVHLCVPHKGHGWKVVERSAVVLCGVSLIPTLYPLLQALAGSGLARLLDRAIGALAGL